MSARMISNTELLIWATKVARWDIHSDERGRMASHAEKTGSLPHTVMDALGVAVWRRYERERETPPYGRATLRSWRLIRYLRKGDNLALLTMIYQTGELD